MTLQNIKTLFSENKLPPKALIQSCVIFSGHLFAGMDKNDDHQYSAATKRQYNAKSSNKCATYSKRRYSHVRSPAKSKRTKNQHFEKLDQPIAIVNDASKDVSSYNFLENNDAAKGDSARKRKAFSRPFKQVGVLQSLSHSYLVTRTVVELPKRLSCGYARMFQIFEDFFWHF